MLLESKLKESLSLQTTIEDTVGKQKVIINNLRLKWATEKKLGLQKCLLLKTLGEWRLSAERQRVEREQALREEAEEQRDKCLKSLLALKALKEETPKSGKTGTTTLWMFCKVSS